MLTSTLEMVTDAPLELTLPMGVLIACALAVILNAIPALKADAELKKARATHFAAMAEERAKRRAGLIAAAREKVSEYDGHTVGGFLPWIEKSAVFLALKPHMDTEGLKKAWGDRAVIHFDPEKGAVTDKGMAFFISETERLARDWNVD